MIGAFVLLHYAKLSCCKAVFVVHTNILFKGTEKTVFFYNNLVRCLFLTSKFMKFNSNQILQAFRTTRSSFDAEILGSNQLRTIKDNKNTEL